MTTNPKSETLPQQLINGELRPLVGMEATSHIPVIKSKAEYLKAVMYEGVRLPPESPKTSNVPRKTSLFPLQPFPIPALTPFPPGQQLTYI